jgi:multidrug efflux pump subunit AcrA (membrane-fusion protein)
MKPSVSAARRVLTARPWVSVVVVLAVAGGGYALYRSNGDASSGAGAATVTTRLVSVSTGTVRESVSSTGTFAPADEQDVSFSSSARITSVRVSQGDKVAKGQILGTIDPVSLKFSLAQARANLANARAALAGAEDNSETTDAQLSADKAAVTSAQSTVSSAVAALDEATLRSPISGTVAEVNVTVGEQSSGSAGGGSGGTGTTGGGATNGAAGSSTGATGSSTSSSSADFVIVGMKQWNVSASVDDTEVGLIAKGDQVQMTTDDVTGTVFGTVSSVSVLSSDSSGSASYPVEIAVTGSPAGLHDGASATVSIIYKQLSDVLTVPALAVHRSGTASYVYVSDSGKKTKTTVTTGLTSGGTTQIKAGLKSGQQVYVDVVTARPRGGSSNTTNQRGGYFPGGGNFPGGGGGYFPGGGNFRSGNFGGGNVGGGSVGGGS